MNGLYCLGGRDACEEGDDTMVSSACSLRWQTFLVKSWEFWMCCEVLPTRAPRMEAKYLEILYVTELMLLTIGLREGPLFMDLRQSIKARDDFSWMKTVV